MANASSNKSGIRFTDKVWTPKGMKLLVDVLPKDCWAKAGDYVSVQTVIRLREKGYDEHKLEDTKVWKPTNCKRTTYKEKWYCEKCGRTANTGKEAFRDTPCIGFSPSCWGYQRRALFLNRMQTYLPTYPTKERKEAEDGI